MKTKEFPKGKENYCPRCYFERDLVIERENCKCKAPKVSEEEREIRMEGIKRVAGLK